MNQRKQQGIIILAVSVAALIAIASGVSSTETYNGDLEDLLIDESGLPEGFVVWETGVHNTTSSEGWTFVPAYEIKPSDEWAFAPTQPPSEYGVAMFIKINENDDPEESVIQMVIRFTPDDIDAMFDTGDWIFVPAPGIDDAIEDDDVRAKVTYYNESGAKKDISLLLTKKDIVVLLSYSSYTDFEYDFVFENAIEVVQRI